MLHVTSLRPRNLLKMCHAIDNLYFAACNFVCMIMLDDPLFQVRRNKKHRGWFPGFLTTPVSGPKTCYIN